MTRALAVLLLVCPATGSAGASLEDGPQQTILWNEIVAVTTVDTLVVAIGPDAIAVCRFDEALEVFVPVNFQLVASQPVSVKSHDTLLLIKTAADVIAVYDLRALPQLVHLGDIVPGVPFSDYVVDGQDLYLSRWFDGIWRFRLDNFETLRLVDTTMAGMLMTQLEVRDDTLYALDAYNGVMRFDVSGPGFGTFIDFLWVPYDMTSFVLADPLVIIPSVMAGVGLGEFGHEGSGIVGFLSGVDGAERVLVCESYYVLVGRRSLSVVSRLNPDQVVTTSLSETALDGDVFRFRDREYLLLPRSGLALYDLADPSVARPGLARNGPITDVLFHDGRLYTGGAHNPVDVFIVDSSATATYSHTLYSNRSNVGAVAHNGDSLLVAYSMPNRVVIIANGAHPDSFYLERSLFVDDSTVADVQYVSTKIDTVRPLLAIAERQIFMYAVTDSSGVYQAGSWRSMGRITSALMHDTVLFVSTSKNQLWILSVLDDLSVELRAVVGLATRCHRMMIVENHLVLFVWDKMIVIEVRDPSHPRIVSLTQLPGPAVAAVKRGDRLYTAGPDGVGVFRLDSLAVELIEFGGRGGTMLDVEGCVLATSNGGSIHLYHLTEQARPTAEPPPLPTAFELAQNYPNPFNAGTRIDYSIPEASRVAIVVYNILGQQVKTLIDRDQPAGTHSVLWNGTDGAGDKVATGVYFYRLTVGNRVSSRKMMLLK